MSWDEIEDIIFKGSKENIDKLMCPECGGQLIVNYSTATNSLEVKCKHCGSCTRQSGLLEVPQMCV